MSLHGVILVHVYSMGVWQVGLTKQDFYKLQSVISTHVGLPHLRRSRQAVYSPFFLLFVGCLSTRIFIVKTS